jgi:transcriptional regulator PpsR
MTHPDSPEPDLTLVLNPAGLIQRAIAGNALAAERLADWIGQPWVETVPDHARSDIGQLLERARQGDLAGIGHVAQRFPSGLVLPLEYTTIRLGDGAGMIAVGKQSRAVAQLQSRLLDTQRVLEQDYWKLRSVETRYRMLLDSAQDAVVTIESHDLRIAEINPPAARLLGLAPEEALGARDTYLPALLAHSDRKTLRDLVRRARNNGLANGRLRTLQGGSGPWLVRASLIPSAPGNPLLQLQITATAAQYEQLQATAAEAHADLIERSPDGFVVIDQAGTVLGANAAFVELTQESGPLALLGESLDRWLGRLGSTDLRVLLASVERFGRLRLFSTLIRGGLGSETEVELSAAGECDVGARRIAVLMRDVGRKLDQSRTDTTLQTLIDDCAQRLGKASLRSVVDETVTLVERHYVEAALRLTAGNRTAAAQLLGLSRQSLHTKLNRYGLEQAPGAEGAGRTAALTVAATAPHSAQSETPSSRNRVKIEQH